MFDPATGSDGVLDNGSEESPRDKRGNGKATPCNLMEGVSKTFRWEMCCAGWCADSAFFNGMKQPSGVSTFRSEAYFDYAQYRRRHKSAILHNGVIEHLGRSSAGADASITDRYVNIAWERVTAPALFANAFTH
jgi:hypothetical protein